MNLLKTTSPNSNNSNYCLDIKIPEGPILFYAEGAIFTPPTMKNAFLTKKELLGYINENPLNFP